MKRKYIYFLLVLVIIAVGVVVYAKMTSVQTSSEYQLTSMTKGNLESTISSSGTLSPLTTIEVGTQVSGIIDTIYVDYNDRVKAGQIMAVLDTLLLKTTVIDAEANVEKAEALLEQAEYQYELNNRLRTKDMISESDMLPYIINVKTQKAVLKSAEAALQRAKSNLDYAIIRAPISGTVISKNIEAGQTVAASLSTPTLFYIAEDLAHMQILVDVDESDIGQIKEGQPVRFEVSSHSDVEFEGVVHQIRMQPEVVSNVVTYTVVVTAENKDDLLMPGMTATVDFIIDKKTDVLLVSNKALRFQPTDAEVKKFQETMKQHMASMPDSLKGGQGRVAGAMNSSGTGNTVGTVVKKKEMGTLWYYNENGELSMEPVRIGMTDGTNTEIVMSRRLTEGSQVIAGTATASSTKTTTSNGGPGFGPPPGF